MKQVIHLMPYDGIGGVELAAKSSMAVNDPAIALSLHYIFPHVSSRAQREATFNPLAFFRAALRIRRADPDLLIVSLWRSSIVGLLVKCLRPRTRLVTFIHNSKDAHVADKLLTRLSARMSVALLFDSESSRQLRLKSTNGKPGAVISFLTRHLPAIPRNDVRPLPRFVFWGRLNKQKNLSRALHLFAAIRTSLPDARFDIIGPDGGAQASLQSLAADLGLDHAVTFHGPQDWDAIAAKAAKAYFYLQTSHYEGMAMSVTEAMQLGLVPIVTPVGEIGTYCTADNAILLGDQAQDPTHLKSILELINHPSRYDECRAAAIAQWTNQRLYCEDLFDQLHLLFSSDTPSDHAQSPET